MNQEIAQTIVSQLGGNRFLAMTGARDLVAIERGVQFWLPSNFALDGINQVVVVLEESDTYAVTFYKRRGLNLKEVARHELVYAEQLRALFESQTGLALSLNMKGK
jgi:hypothetical protein